AKREYIEDHAENRGVRNAWTLHPASECHGPYCKRFRNPEFSSTGVYRGRNATESAARGAGNRRYREWGASGGRKRQVRTIFGNDADGAGIRQRRGDPADLDCGAGEIAFPYVIEHEKRRRDTVCD